MEDWGGALIDDGESEVGVDVVEFSIEDVEGYCRRRLAAPTALLATLEEEEPMSIGSESDKGVWSMHQRRAQMNSTTK